LSAGDDDAANDKQRPHNGRPAHGFPQQEVGGHYSDKGLEIDIVIGVNDSQPVDDNIPHGKADGTAQHRQEQNAEQRSSKTS